MKPFVAVFRQLVNVRQSQQKIVQWRDTTRNQSYQTYRKNIRQDRLQEKILIDDLKIRYRIKV